MSGQTPRMELLEIGCSARRTWRFVAPRQRLALLAAIALMATVGYCAAQIPLILGYLVDQLLAGEVPSLWAAQPILLTLGGIYLLRELLQVVRKVLVERNCTTIERDATVRVTSNVFALDLAYLSSERAGSWNGRMHQSVEGLVRLLKLAFLDFFPALFTAFFALYVATSRHVLLGLLMAAIIPIAFIIITWQISSQSGTRLWLLRAKQELDGTIVEQLGGIENVRAANTLELEVGKVASVADNLRRREFRHHLAMMFFDAGKSLNEGVFHILVILLALFLTLQREISPGDILAFSLLFAAVVAPLREIHRILDEGHESALRTRDFFDLLDQPADRSFAAKGHLPVLSPDEPLIEANGFEVRYGHSAPALSDVRLCIRAGETVGIAGPSGSGKTSLIRALLRLVHAAGDLRIAGVPIEHVSREAVGETFGLVSQKPFIFTGTVAENIAYGSSGATLAEIADAARRASIDREIEALPEQYQTLVSERGNSLSGGQCQRIALARIFLKNPPVIVLDEATSALDYANERAVMDAIDQLMKGRTVIIIAHRLSSLARTDRIYFFEAGRLIEQGSYCELTTGPSRFSQMLHGEHNAIASQSAALGFAKN